MKKSDFDGLIEGLKEASDLVRTGKLKGGRMRDGPARVLLTMLSKDPGVVLRTLKSAA
jgi:hypothetical protein